GDALLVQRWRHLQRGALRRELRRRAVRRAHRLVHQRSEAARRHLRRFVGALAVEGQLLERVEIRDAPDETAVPCGAELEAAALVARVVLLLGVGLLDAEIAARRGRLL